MKVFISVLFLALLYMSHADELSDCKCWSNYEPQKYSEGVRCSGILLFHAMECNVPEPPRCECSGNVTGILTDSTGIWCSEYDSGKEVRRWPCENKEEWDKFHQLHPEQKPK